MNYRDLRRADRHILSWIRHISDPGGRIALFIVFFWFGILKVLGVSPAHPLIINLLEETLRFISFEDFIIFFGIFEMVIGILFLIPRTERVALLFLGLHMITTFMPLFLLPSVTWANWFIPTLEGQYILKNLVIIALAMGVAAHLEPLHRRIHI